MEASGGPNNEHHLISLKEPTPNLVALRQELAFHPDITAKAQHSSNFEECLGSIALELGIALDGLYDADDLCRVLVHKLRQKRFGLVTLK